MNNRELWVAKEEAWNQLNTVLDNRTKYSQEEYDKAIELYDRLTVEYKTRCAKSSKERN